MDEKIEWKDVTTHDELVKYIKDHIGMDNLYDELYEDLMSDEPPSVSNSN